MNFQNPERCVNRLNQALELSLLKFRIGVARNQLRDLGEELGIVAPVSFYPRFEVEVDESLFGEGYRKESLIPYLRLPKIERKHVVAAGLVTVGIVLTAINHHLNKK